MDLPEMNEVFDVLFNNITSNMAPGLDSYEKSVFLTKAQDEILKAYFNPKSNKILEGYDDSQRRDIDFSMITVTKRYTTADITDVKSFSLHSNAKSVVLPDNIMFMLDEQLVVNRNNANAVLQVIPLAYSEFTRLMQKPYKRPLRNQAWRLTNCEGNEHSIDIVPSAGDVIQSYIIRYVKRPKPIILENLEGVEIDGIDTATPCELDKILHQEIVQRAVELAKAAFEGTLASAVQVGNLSSTGLGIISSGDSKK